MVRLIYGPVKCLCKPAQTFRHLWCSVTALWSRLLCWVLLPSAAYYEQANLSGKHLPSCFLVFLSFKSPPYLIISSLSLYFRGSVLIYHNLLLFFLFSSGHGEQSVGYFPRIFCKDHKTPPREWFRRWDWRQLLQLSALLPAHPLWSRHQVSLCGQLSERDDEYECDFFFLISFVQCAWFVAQVLCIFVLQETCILLSSGFFVLLLLYNVPQYFNFLCKVVLMSVRKVIIFC